MSSALFYQLLLGELNLLNEEAGAAFSLLLDAARQTGDARLFQRSVEYRTAIARRRFRLAGSARLAEGNHLILLHQPVSDFIFQHRRLVHRSQPFAVNDAHATKAASHAFAQEQRHRLARLIRAQPYANPVGPA